MKSLSIYRILPVLLITALAGCGESETQSRSQIAAKVNNDEITIHQIDLAMEAMGEQAANSDEKALRKAVLNNMIIQTLLEQQAEKSDLDREPHVMEEIEAAKRRVLASAYMQQITTVNPSISDADIERYYFANTDLFANRKLFVYEQLTVQSKIDNFDVVEKKVRESGTLNEFMAWLQKRSIPYKVITEAKTSEHIPQNLLKPLSTLDVGQVGFLTLNDGLVVIEVKDKQVQPVEYDMAAPAIKHLLQSKQQQAQLENTVSSLKNSAVIEYNEDYQPDAKTLSMDNNQSMPVGSQESFIEKGLQGLK